jgi:hypothetical protein
LPVQVITISRQEYEETRDVIGGIAYPAAKYGGASMRRREEVILSFVRYTTWISP